MDPRLAEIYGTNEEATDVEKTAAAELAEKLASENEMDIDGMADEDIEALAQEVLSADSNEEETETEEGETETTDKVAEADYLGRVMAHAYVQELKGIDKEAKVGNVMAKLKAMGAGAKKSGKKLFAKGKKKATELGAKGKAHAMAAGKKVDKAVKKNPYKTIGGASLMAGGAGVMAGRKSKEASALDTLAAERAREILAENGVELAAAEETEEKQAGTTKFDALAAAVEARAQELLVNEGYEFEESDEAAEE